MKPLFFILLIVMLFLGNGCDDEEKFLTPDPEVNFDYLILQSDNDITANLKSVFFYNDNLGWVAGQNGTIYHTINGGDSWFAQNSNSNFDLFSILFSDSVNGIAVGDFGTLITTNDGGNNWTRQTVLNGHHLQAIAITPIFQKYVTGDKIIGKFETDVWTELPNWTPTILYGITTPNKSDIWVCGLGGSIIHSPNAGTDWQSQTSTALNPLLDIYFRDSLHGWTVGVGGKIIRTEDGGKSWINVDGATTEVLRSVHFSNSLLGFVAGDNGTLLLSENGGTSWIHKTPPVITSFFDVYYANQNLAWVCGDNGTILKITRFEITEEK